MPFVGSQPNNSLSSFGIQHPRKLLRAKEFHHAVRFEKVLRWHDGALPPQGWEKHLVKIPNYRQADSKRICSISHSNDFISESP